MSPVSFGKLFLLIPLSSGLSLMNFGNAQQGERIVIPLRLNQDAGQKIGRSINFGDESGRRSRPIAPSGTSRLARVPGGAQIRVQGLREPEHAYKVTMDSDGDGEFAGEETHTLLPNTSIQVTVIRNWAERRVSLPYTIDYSRLPNQKGEIEESMAWRSHYQAEGQFTVGSCGTLIVVLDLNGDGQFDDRDFKMGTSILLDRNHDGRIWGKDEWLRGDQIIEHCGKYFVVDNLRTDASTVSLVETLLRPVQLGDPLPRFNLITTDGTVIPSEGMRGKVFVLDFWASWCNPCVEKFSILKEMASHFASPVEVIAVNVDDGSRLQEARKVIISQKLAWPNVINGLGEADPLWKVFGSTGDNRLSIPLYVVIDKNGVVRYAGNGGPDLGELRKRLGEVIEFR